MVSRGGFQLFFQSVLSNILDEEVDRSMKVFTVFGFYQVGFTYRFPLTVWQSVISFIPSFPLSIRCKHLRGLHPDRFLFVPAESTIGQVLYGLTLISLVQL